MNIYQLLELYSRKVKEWGKVAAQEYLFDLGYNRTITMCIFHCFDKHGNPKELLRKER
jgi:hypothetical protein